MNEISILDIGKKLDSSFLKRYRKVKNAKVIRNMKLPRGRERLDLSVVKVCDARIESFIHGIEIKSSKDKFVNFGKQFTEYKKVCSYLTYMVAEQHAEKIQKEIPKHTGLYVFFFQKKRLTFEVIREATKNTEDIRGDELMRYFWKSELREILNKTELPRAYEKILAQAKRKSDLIKIVEQNVSKEKIIDMACGLLLSKERLCELWK